MLILRAYYLSAGGYTNHVETRRLHTSGFSAIRVAAVLSVVVLMGAVGWRGYEYLGGATLSATNTGVATSTSSATDNQIPITQTVGSTAIGAAVLDDLVSRYNSLQERGIYTPEIGQKVAEEMASTLIPEVPFTRHTAAEVVTDPTMSSDRALTYRRDLQESLKPLLENKQAGFEIFALYTDTRDPKYLTELRQAAENYRKAVHASMQVIVPKDAVDEHVAILNALEQFAATLDAQAMNANDPLASVALLRTYNESEAGVLSSFNALATYFREKTS